MTVTTTPNKRKEPLYSGLRASPAHEHIISALVENQPGVLAHISGMFAARSFNIASLAVGFTSDPTVSRMTIVCVGDDRVVEQIIKQLRKIITVIRVVDMRERPHIERELLLVKAACTKKSRSEIMQIVDIFRANIVDVSADSIIAECTARGQKVDAIEGLLEKFGIIEMVRTGKTALVRDGKMT